jgi:hypothetical protein
MQACGWAFTRRAKVTPILPGESEGAFSPEGLEPAAGLFLPQAELILSSVAVHLFGGLDDRPIPGAAAKVAGQDVVDPRPRGRVFVLVERKERHDETRRAKAALGGVAVDHRLLHRMQAPLGGFEAFHGDELLAVEDWQEQDAGVDGLVAKPVARRLAEHHRAGAAVALRAALLRAGLALLDAQVLQHGHVGIEIRQAPLRVVQQEAEGFFAFGFFCNRCGHG